MGPFKAIILLATLVCLTHAQTTTARPGILGNIFNPQFQAMKAGIQFGTDMKSKGLQLAMNSTRQGVAGVMGAKQSLMNMAANLGSNFAQFGADAVKAGATLATALTPPIPFLREGVVVGAGLADTMATVGNAMAQTALTTANAGGKALTEGITSVVNGGTQVASNIGTSLIDMKKGALNTMVDLGIAGVGMADGGLAAAQNAATSSLEALNSVAGSVSAAATNIANENRAALQASGSLSTGAGINVSGSGSVQATSG